MRELTAEFWPPRGVDISRRRNEPGPIVLPPIHDHRIVVHASVATWSTCRATGKRHLRRNGDIDVVPSGEEGGYDAATASEALVIRFSPGLLERVANEMELGGGRSQLETRHLLRNDRIVHLARALDSDRLAGAPGGPLYADSIGVALAIQLLDLSRKEASGRRGLSAAQLQLLYDFIEAHLDQSLTLEVLGREAGASSSHLRHWFKAATGTTVHRHILRRRVERARLLLLQGALSASEIALAAGFSHQSHMARWMRRELGCTPRDLRRP
jgi:AraC family transcriptional regulator